MNQGPFYHKEIDDFLLFGNNKMLFDGVKVFESIEISGMLIVLTVNINGIFPTENVYGIDLKQKKTIWRIGKLDYINESYCPFVGIKYFNNQLYLNKFLLYFLRF